MNNNIKLTVSVTMPGARRHQIGTEKKVILLTKKQLFPNYKGKDGDKIVRKKVRVVPIYEYIPCIKNMKMTYDAFNYMISDEKPDWYFGSWKKLSKKQRLEEHLKRVMEDNRGMSYSYTILED